MNSKEIQLKGTQAMSTDKNYINEKDPLEIEETLEELPDSLVSKNNSGKSVSEETHETKIDNQSVSDEYQLNIKQEPPDESNEAIDDVDSGRLDTSEGETRLFEKAHNSMSPPNIDSEMKETTESSQNEKTQ